MTRSVDGQGVASDTEELSEVDWSKSCSFI